MVIEMSLVNKSFKEHLNKTLGKDIRYDMRKKDAFRDIKVELGVATKAEGSCRVTMGNTVVIAGTKLSIEKPYPDRPEEGSFSVNTELLPLSSPDFESGPPSIDAIEISRVADRTLREGRAVDFKKLLITSGEKAWTIFIDVVSINDDGNLLDASELAALGALLDTKFPKVDKNGIIDYKTPGEKRLEVDSMPVLVTVCKQGSNLFVDPLRAEEEFIEGRLSIGFLDDGTICALQKGGDAPLTTEEIKAMCALAAPKAVELRKLFNKGDKGATKKKR